MTFTLTYIRSKLGSLASKPTTFIWNVCSIVHTFRDIWERGLKWLNQYITWQCGGIISNHYRTQDISQGWKLEFKHSQYFNSFEIRISFGMFNEFWEWHETFPHKRLLLVKTHFSFGPFIPFKERDAECYYAE